MRSKGKEDKESGPKSVSTNDNVIIGNRQGRRAVFHQLLAHACSHRLTSVPSLLTKQHAASSPAVAMTAAVPSWPSAAGSSKHTSQTLVVVSEGRKGR